MEAVIQSQPQVESSNQNALRSEVKKHVENYLHKCRTEDVTPDNLYDLLLDEIEEPFLTSVFKYCNRNQSLTAIYLGLSRGTTRKKLKKYGLID